MLRLSQAVLKRGHFSLGPIDFQVAPGSINLIVGRNGAGKTSLLQLIMSRLKPVSGEIQGNQIQLGSLGVENILIESWTVEENLHWYSALSQRETLHDFLQDIRPLFPQKVSHLSSGMRRLVELSIILSQSFSLYLLDEAFSHLDHEYRDLFESKFEELRKQGSSFILTCHSKNDFKNLKADNILTL